MPGFREPVSGFTHLGGVLLALAGTAVLLHDSLIGGSFDQGLSFAVYGASLISLYLASALFYLLMVSDERRDFWRQAPQSVYNAFYLLMTLVIIGFIPLIPLARAESKGWYGYYEMFHLFVLGGSLCHFGLIYLYVA